MGYPKAEGLWEALPNCIRRPVVFLSEGLLPGKAESQYPPPKELNPFPCQCLLFPLCHLGTPGSS